ncbi:MAG TPA: TonB-dependent receptor [Puia sp.]|nr:TonB-dependent receptor [Puia sp.]
MKKFIFLLFLTPFFKLSSQAQTSLVKGKVLDDSTGTVIPGASVVITGTGKGTSTGPDGSFTIQLPADGKSHMLQISHSGYGRISLPLTVATAANGITARLTRQAQSLEDVVIIGYQTVKRRDLTGSVSSITAKDLKDNPTVNAAEALEGKLAGVQITVADGRPGATADIYIRGRSSITQTGSPLYIVDGVQVDNALNVLSPQDIESIDVLKDAASTSIYGARGSNGVVIITTKGGRNTGGKTSLTYTTTMGFQKLPKELSVMNPFDFIEFQYERAKITNDTTVISRYYRTGDSYARIDSFRKVPMVDWQKKTMGRDAFFQTHNISMSGGNQQTQYNLSVTYNDQNGILVFTDYKRALVNFRLDHKVSERLKVGFNVRYNNNVIDGAGTSDPGSAQLNNLRQIVRYQPVLLPGQSDTYYDPNQAASTNGNGLSLVNPFALLAAQYRKSSNNVLDLNANATYTIVKNLSLRSVVAVDFNNLQIRSFDDTVTPNSRANGGTQPIASVTTGGVRTINNSNVLEYSNTSLFGSRHSLNILAGQETYQTYTTASYLELHGIPVGTSPGQAFANYTLAQTVLPPTASEVPVQNLSYFGRLSYNYKSRYFAVFNLRADGSSIFGPLHKWGYFPSGSVAWRISDESFMQSQHLFSDLKIRASYGSVGNNRITPYSFGNFFASGRPYYLNDAFIFGSSTTGLGNPNLQWESQISRNIGLDAVILKGRLSVTVDAYRNTTSNLLLNNTIPSNSGYTTQFQNVGSTQNTGLEVQANGTIMQSQTFRWTGSFNISWNSNIVKSLGAQQQFFANSGYFNTAQQPADFLVKVGQQVGTMWGLVNDGYYKITDFDNAPYSNTLYPWATTKYTLKKGVPTSSISSTLVQPGTQKFKDVNGDGKIDGTDYKIIGHALPKFIGGFSQNFNYKSFDLSLFFNYSYGNTVANYNKLEFTSTYTNGANLLSTFDNRYRTVDPSTGLQVQGVPTAAIGAIGASPDVLNALNAHAKYWIPVQGVEWDNSQSFAMEDGSFLRLNNVTLGYALPKTLLSKIKIASIRVFVTVNNVATLTGYSGYDPDVSTRRATPITAGVDYSAYPRSRSFYAGLNVTF